MTMASPGLTLPIFQLTGGKTHLAATLNNLLETPGLQRFRVAVSYVRWSGLGLLAHRLEAFLKAGGEFQSVYGVENGVTSPDSLFYSLYLQQIYRNHSFAGMISDEYANATYHPKMFEFTFEKKTVVVVGSNNLTAGGLSNNIEFSLKAEFISSDAALSELDDAWNAITALAMPVTLDSIRQLKERNKLGSELEKEPGGDASSLKPFVKSSIKSARRPLFLKVLDVQNNSKKNAFINNLDVVTERPKRLYLQILKYETGGTEGNAGYQVQLPVATLPAFFGVAPDKTQSVSFKFGSVVVDVTLTHFGNNTHRVRLKPIQKIPRPAIIIFDRVSDHEYECSFVPKRDYSSVLASKCNQQTRSGARKWGIWQGP